LDFVTNFTPPVTRGPIGSSLPAILRNAMAALALGAVLLGVSGCGDTFRPPVSSISPVGPASQPAKYAVVVSDPGNGAPGVFTMVDFSGDTVLNNTNIGVAPLYFILGFSGTEGYVLNKDGSVNSFGISSSLLSNQVQTGTLLPGAGATTIFPSSSYTYFTEPYPATPANAAIAEAQGSPPSVKQELSVGANPVFIAGTASSSRIYAISQGANNVTAIQTGTNTISNTIPVGSGPVYGVMTADNNRAFILNKTDGTVSIINVNTNQLDTPPAPNTNPIPVGGGPVWADTYYPGSLLVTANSTGNSISIISTPLCSIVALPTNPLCDTTNPTDDVGFGTVLATVPVGNNPQMVSILQDGTRAYVVNTATPTTTGSVSVVSLSTFTVTKTIPFDGLLNSDGTPNVNHGPACHPNFIATSQGTPTGKVYVSCADGSNLVVLRTDTDSLQTLIPLQGNAVQLRVTAQ